MRLQDIMVDVEALGMEGKNRDNKPFIIVYSNGKAKLSYLPNHGETKVITHEGRVKRVRYDEGENF